MKKTAAAGSVCFALTALIIVYLAMQPENSADAVVIPVSPETERTGVRTKKAGYQAPSTRPDFVSRFGEEYEPVGWDEPEYVPTGELHLQFENLLLISDQSERYGELDDLARTLGRGLDYALAYYFFGRLEPHEDKQRFAGIFIETVLQQEDLSGAALWALEIEDRVISGIMVELIAANLAAGDPSAAAQWAASLPDEALAIAAYGRIIDSVAKRDWPLAYEWASQFSDSNLRNAMIKRTGFVFAEKEPVAAAQWALGIEDTETSSAIVNHALKRWVSKDFDSALDWVEQLPDQYKNKEMMDVVSMVWAEYDPHAAIDWVNRADGAFDKKSVFFNIATVWSEDNPGEAANWARNTFGGQPFEGTILSQIAYHWIRQDPLQAVRWLSRPPVDDSKYEALKAAVGIWASQDPAGAQSWIESSGFPPSYLEHLNP